MSSRKLDKLKKDVASLSESERPRLPMILYYDEEQNPSPCQYDFLNEADYKKAKAEFHAKVLADWVAGLTDTEKLALPKPGEPQPSFILLPLSDPSLTSELWAEEARRSTEILETKIKLHRLNTLQREKELSTENEEN